MILYHGSFLPIETPDTKHSRIKVDFGKGFYTTPLYSQAKTWCERFKRQGKKGIISKYTFSDNVENKVKILQFDTYSESWLDFILTCRNGIDTSDYDIVIGGVANDRVFNTIELYFDKLIDKKEAIKRLQYEKPNLQVCFRTQDVIDKYITFEGWEEV